MKKEIQCDRSSAAWLAFEEFSGLEATPINQRFDRKANCEMPVASPANEQIGIPTPIIPEK